VFILRFDLESAYALGGERTAENWRLWIDEAAAAVARICGVLERHEVPATFFVLGALLEKAGDRIASILRHTPLVEVQSHSYSHMMIKSEETAVADQLRRELRMTSDLIAEHFGTRPIGFCAPGNFYRGLQGCKGPLEVLWDEGYRFIGTDGSGPPEQPMPAPFTQPYWYAEDGFPDLLEEPITGWHCNMLFNTGGQSDNWKPAPGLPDGTVLDALPVTVDEGLRVRESTVSSTRPAITRGRSTGSIPR
jgi:peptidoglycan/xylan/chitin deacetylase (PgdA/CDA1 family)